MESKLTLSIDKELIKKAKKYAKTQKTSLSDLVESYFRILSADEPVSAPRVSRKLKSLRGILKTEKK